MAKDLLDAGDILYDGRMLVECAWMAAAKLSKEERDPLMAVLQFAGQRIDKARSILERIRDERRRGEDHEEA